MNNILITLFSVNSVWSIIGKGLIWIIAVIILAYGADEGHKRKRIKNEVGLFFAFISGTGALIYLVFGFSPLS